MRRLKGAGLQVGVIVMVGVGGDRFAEGHVARTPDCAAVHAVGSVDIICLSGFVEQPDTPYPALAAAHGIRSLPPESRRQQAEALRAGLRALAGPRVAPYALEAFLYG